MTDLNTENYDFPDEHFEKLYEYQDNTPEYCIVQGAVYDELRSRGHRFDAGMVSTMLNNGDVEVAELTVREMLEEK